MKTALPALLIALIALIAAHAPPAGARDAPAGDWGAVREIFANAAAQESEFQPGPLPWARALPFAGGYHAVYTVEVWPGVGYTLGLVCPATLRRVQVYLYDRWPLAPGARRVDLPMGPLVATHPQRHEYRWQLGISPRSTDTLMYVVVVAEPGARATAAPRHAIYLSSPPLVPGATLEQGVTYLQGPSDFVLAGGPPRVAYVVERPAAPAPTLASLPLPGDLIRNARFAQGLNDWQPHRDYDTAQPVQSVSLHPEGLRIAAAEGNAREGVLQRLEANVANAEALTLRADVRVTRQSEAGTGADGRRAPIAIGICYEDVRGAEHCRERMYWKGFYSLAPSEAGGGANGQKVPPGQWYRFIADLAQLDPKPRIIKLISLEGAGLPEREGWVREVHLIKRSAKPS